MKTNLLTGVLLITVIGCAPDISETEFFREHPEEVDPTTQFIEIGSQVSDGFTFRVLAPEPLTIGYSTVWLEVLNEGNAVTEGQLTLNPVWGSATNAVMPPFTHEPAVFDSDLARFAASPFFLQPAEETGAWELHVDYDLAGTAGSLVFDIEVNEDIWVQHVDNADAYYVSWVLPVRPTTGNDVIQFALHRLTATGFEPVDDALIDLYPYMDMGAGEGHSTPFDAPVHAGNGMYSGQINFIMSGGWDMTAYVQRGTAPPDTVVFKGFTVY